MRGSQPAAGHLGSPREHWVDLPSGGLHRAMWTGLDLRELRGRAEEKPLPLKKKNFRVLLGEGFEFGERENSSRGNGL